MIGESANESRSRVLDAKRATLILVAYFLAQVACAFATMVISEAPATGQSIHASRQTDVIPHFAPVGMLSEYLIGGVVIFLILLKLAPASIRDAGPGGAAWVACSWQGMAGGIGIGLIIGILNQTLIFLIGHKTAHRDVDILHKMAHTPGLGQITYLIIALLLAPLVEEALFRGVLYGGYRKSFGNVWAAVITSSLFVMIHYLEYVRFFPNIFGIIAATGAVLWCRLRWGSIIPAMMAHVGYNFMIVLPIVFKIKS